jgi:pimeloyl-ACP methyl ester carboxylesterase
VRQTQRSSTRPVPEFEQQPENRQLAVLLHAFTLGRDNLAFVRDALAAARPTADIYAPSYDSRLWSTEDPNVIVQRVRETIDELVAKKDYDEIIFIGHSLGALLARKLYIAACGQNADAPFEETLPTHARSVWVSRVRRIVLIAGMNGGWSISHHMSLRREAAWTLGSMVATIWMSLTRKQLLIFTIRRGAAFITQLRIQWLSMLRHAPTKEIQPALTVQLLGTVDDLVAPQDNVDLVTGADFVYLEVPHSGHLNVIDMWPATEAGRHRIEALSQALNADPRILKLKSLPQRDLLPQPDVTVTDVIFVVHGIRDVGYWTQKIAQRVMTMAKVIAPDRRYAMVTPSYGYFAMLPFLVLAQRLDKVRWLMEEYTKALVRYPNANFSYVGHSNGTYLLARALRDYPSTHFNHVVFAGSVVRTNYDWRTLMRGPSPRIVAVCNCVASRDWVVALFPKAFELLRIQDLGSAGHDGFSTLPDELQVEFAKGGHSAALEESWWNTIANFIVSGPPAVLITPVSYSKDPSRPLVIASKIAPVVWILIVAILALALFGIINFFPSGLRTAAVIIYLWLIFLFLTRF